MTEAEQLFEQVYRTYGPSLYRFCLIQMKNPADAEDILQEVFCKRLYRAPVFTSPDHEQRWLFRVALNQCRDAWKRSNRSELPLEAASGAHALLAGDEGACDAIGGAVRALQDASRYDARLGGFAESLESALIDVEDVASDPEEREYSVSQAQ